MHAGSTPAFGIAALKSRRLFRDILIPLEMKKETVKLIKKSSRERIPVSSLKGKVVPSKKRKLMEKALKEEEKTLQR